MAENKVVVKNNNKIHLSDYILHFPTTWKHLKKAQKEKRLEEEKRLNALPKVYRVKMSTYKPRLKRYRGFEFEFMHKEKKYYYCVLIKEKQDHTEQAYRLQAKFKFNALVKSKSFAEYVHKGVGLVHYR